MPAAERAARSAVLVARIRALPSWATARVALGFHPFGSEPDISPLLAGPTPRVLLPRLEGPRLVFASWCPGDPLTRSAFGVLEPTGPPVEPANAQVALVPGLAFDADNHRLGYGGGFYDRALAALPRTVVTIGVCFAHERRLSVPHDDGDVAVDVVVTDEG
jgi:5-formyltetrahydrofolate cyclo-ligase